jgi:tRNA A-37 threonylcarbamoyl transferase component Bud32
MTENPVGAGREADIISLGGGRVLRQYRDPRDVELEALAMEHARAHGVPVPGVFEVRENAIVMERIEGRTMLAYAATTGSCGGTRNCCRVSMNVR